MAHIDFFFDIGSPYTYLAFQRIPDVISETGATVAHRPFLLGAVFKATGNSMPALVPARGQWMLTDLQRSAQRYGVPFTFPPFFPINSLLPMRALATFDSDEVREPAGRVFDAYWGEGRDVSKPDILAGLIGSEAVSGAQEQSVKDALRANTEEAVARGAFGAPTFFVGDAMVFGNDRLDVLVDLALG